MHNAYRGGTPDVWYSGPARDLWIEYKWVQKLTAKPPALSPLQKDWLDKRYDEGRNVMVVVGHPGGAATYEVPRQWGDGSAHRLITLEALVALIHGRCV